MAKKNIKNLKLFYKIVALMTAGTFVLSGCEKENEIQEDEIEKLQQQVDELNAQNEELRNNTTGFLEEYSEKFELEKELEHLQLQNDFLSRAQELNNYGLVCDLTFGNFDEAIVSVNQATINGLNILDENGYQIVNALFSEILEGKFVYRLNCENVTIVDFSKVDLSNVYYVNNRINFTASEECHDYIMDLLIDRDSNVAENTLREKIQSELSTGWEIQTYSHSKKISLKIPTGDEYTDQQQIPTSSRFYDYLNEYIKLYSTEKFIIRLYGSEYNPNLIDFSKINMESIEQFEIGLSYESQIPFVVDILSSLNQYDNIQLVSISNYEWTFTYGSVSQALDNIQTDFSSIEMNIEASDNYTDVRDNYTFTKNIISNM